MPERILTQDPEKALAGPKPRYEYIRQEIPADLTFKPDTINLVHNRLIVSTLVMALTSLALFFLPMFNGLLAGTFGGFHARRLPRALGAATLSAVAVPTALAFLIFIGMATQSHLFYGLGFWGYTALYVIGLFIGAVTGAISHPFWTSYRIGAPTSVSAPRTRAPDAAPRRRPTT
ncbi:hypothetical protein [Myxococcus sp. SDU36]|uniref:hypothetical protein n=1 Tax=Myxococcus sp. SDU36 TaxID=2831967 RepID=UPI002543A626|nr:hypothetical protein [Myxococcus sp. SDU36]WIG93526.1 hypothetical protein KGD87_23410 [Myxococcus sp. SDU36]